MGKSYNGSCMAVNNGDCLNNYNGGFSLDGVTLANRMKQARKAAGMTQAALAAASGVKQQMVSKLERGESMVTSDIVALAMAMDVSAVWLSTGQERKDAMDSAAPYAKLPPQVVSLARRIAALPPSQRRLVEQVLESQEIVAIARREKKRAYG